MSLWPKIPFPEVKTQVHAETYTHKFIAVASTRASQGADQVSLREQRTSTVWPIPRTEYYLATNRNEALTGAVVQVDLEASCW